jgi:hypothetical protein
MRDPRTDPAVRRRMAMARYARSHNQTRAARHFGCCWATIQAAVRRVEEYERSGDIRGLQNKPRDKTPAGAEKFIEVLHRFHSGDNSFSKSDGA